MSISNMHTLSHPQRTQGCKNCEWKSAPIKSCINFASNINPEIECAYQFQNSNYFVMTNEKSLFFPKLGGQNN